MFNEKKAKEYRRLSIVSQNAISYQLSLVRDLGLERAKESARYSLEFARQDRLSAEFWGWKRP